MEEELEFAFERHLDDDNCDDIDLPYEALEAIAKQQKRVLEMCKESAAKAKEDGDISYEQEYICMKWMEALEKRTLANLKKSRMKHCLMPTLSEMDMKKTCYSKADRTRTALPIQVGVHRLKKQSRSPRLQVQKMKRRSRSGLPQKSIDFFVCLSISVIHNTSYYWYNRSYLCTLDHF